MKSAAKKTKAKSRVVPGKVYPTTIVDADGKLPLPDEFVKDMNIKASDKFACWKEGGGYMVVFPKSSRRKAKIPKDAVWGKVE